MKHARKDYDRIQDPALENPQLLGEGCTPIGEDEPVFLLRAQDALMVATLAFYRQQCIHANMPQTTALIPQINRHIEAVRIWQFKHKAKLPDAPKE